MKKYFFILVLVVVVGCSPQEEIVTSFPGISDDVQQGLIDFIQSSVSGIGGDVSITTEEIGLGFVGEIDGNVTMTSGEVISYSFLEDKLIEVDRVSIEADGSWGPITVLYGPKALLAVDGGVVRGYLLAPQVFAMADLGQAQSFSDFVIDPKLSGLAALALVHSGQYQAAADLLAGLRSVHTQYSGLPAEADVFGQMLAQEFGTAATAWAGYAAAVLAKETNNSGLWQEAKTYGQYLSDVPADTEGRLAGWLLFSQLAEQYSEFAELAERWIPSSNLDDPFAALGVLLSDADLDNYNISQVPVSPMEKWIHYNLLAGLGQLPTELELADVIDVSMGTAVTDGNEICLEATLWMALTLSGNMR